MVEWYEKKLSFRVTKRLFHPRYGYRIAFLENKGFAVELIEQKGSKKHALAFKDPAQQTKIQGLIHFAFKVKDVDKAAEELEKRGVRFAWKPRSVEEVRMRFFHILDVEGNLIEFTQDL
jgi:predicted enzyme related to lactoylglutathione lyase